MSLTVGNHLRTLAFGDVGGGLWGAALHTATPLLVFGDSSGATWSAALPAEGWSAEGVGWRLTGDQLELHVAPGGEAEEMESGEDQAAGDLSGCDELCRVRGTVAIGGTTRTIDCVGTRCVIDGVDAGSLGSARMVSGWFGQDEAFILLALRAADAVGQESDLVAATLFDPEGWIPVNDPRLSTTYAPSGLPARTNLELWVGEGDNEFPRRVAGEASADGAAFQMQDTELRVIPMRCHSQGREGTGVYVLATF
ncbi:MAG TPA: hypothetical protein VE571_05880 [Solirubrobacteraceae bacterium]|nr:hypothetical protein [Solirubrobacteraceae bacterium]